MYTVLVGLSLVCAAVFVGVMGLALVDRVVSWESRRKHNDVAGFIYAVVGITYAVLLGLVVIAVWGSFEAARNTAASEANELGEIFWLADRLPASKGEQIQSLARSYAEVVVEEEWPMMERGRGSSPRAWALVDDLRRAVQGYEPRTIGEQVLYQEAMERVHDFADARGMRLEEAQEGIPTILWIVLVIGGISTVGFTYLFGMENTWAHRLMVATLAMVLALVLFTVGAMEYPFSGGARIGPGAFELILERIETSKLSEL
jgi:Protein of unknown function (DUF4239)